MGRGVGVMLAVGLLLGGGCKASGGGRAVVDGGVVGDGGADTSRPRRPGPGATPPVLDSVVARQAGASGKDVRIDVAGSDAAGDATSLRLVLLDGTGADIVAFDSDGDGSLDTGETTLPLDLVVSGQVKVTSYALFPLMHEQYPALGSVTVALVDAKGDESEEMTVTVTEQPVLALNELCDSTFVRNRCAAGLGCKGNVPQVCTEGVAPTLARAAYLDDELGPRVLVEGVDLDADVESYTLDFLNSSDQPVMLDLDGDGTSESSSFTGTVPASSGDGEFFVAFQPSEVFIAAVAKVRVSVRDAGVRDSEKKTVARQAATEQRPGAACDPRGFDRCMAGNVCSPGVVGESNRCTAISAARTHACSAALSLVPGKGITSVKGEIGKLSAWDSPSGCSTNDPKYRPEAVVKLVLDAPATKVSLSTDNSYTNFDTTLYALASCGAEPLVAWCADDQPDGARAQLAVLELADLPAGQYFIVVDSFPSSSTGKRFQLDVAVE